MSHLDGEVGRQALAQPPIFVQAMWRSGSTYVWKKFREQPQYRAYYEPLHECYSWPREQVQAAMGAEARAALRHRDVEEFYASQMPFTAQGGVEHFRKALSYERYCLQEQDEDAELRRYVANLIAHAEGRGQRPVLQFNRGLLRAGWLKRNFASVQILVLRRPLNIWRSFARFAGHGFHAYMCAILGQNQQKHPLTHLPRWLDIPRHLRASFAEEYPLYQQFAATNVHRLYPAFFDFNLVATLHAARHADCILDLDELSVNPAARAAAGERLGALGIGMSLDDCAAPSYERDASPPPAQQPPEIGDDGEWRAYESFSLEYLSRTLPPDISISAKLAERHRPALSRYFNQIFALFTDRAAGQPQPEADRVEAGRHKHRVAIGLFESYQYRAAATLFGSALADQPSGELWNDWATSQMACGHSRLAELGFRQALRSEPTYRAAAGSLGALLLEHGECRQALPLLQAAELEADAQTRPELSRLVNQAREALGFSPPAPSSSLAPGEPPAPRRGRTIFFTGLSGAGKSTIATALAERLAELDRRPVTLLDGDAVRGLLSCELGFSKQHRDMNILRIGFVAAQVARGGGTAVCACIAPYDQTRKQVRAMIEAEGDFILVHLATPLGVCEQRDAKGLYARARRGELPRFTGVSDPYEPPEDAELTLDTAGVSVVEAVSAILVLLAPRGCAEAASPPRYEELLLASPG